MASPFDARAELMSYALGRESVRLRVESEDLKARIAELREHIDKLRRYGLSNRGSRGPR